MFGERPPVRFGLHRGNAQHATISLLCATKDHMAAGLAVAVVVVVERFMAKILGRASQRHDSLVVVELEAVVNPFVNLFFWIRGRGSNPRLQGQNLTCVPLHHPGIVGVVRFELTASRIRAWRYYQLSYTPRTHMSQPSRERALPRG